MNDYRIEFNNIPWDTARGVKAKCFQRGDKKLRLVEFTQEFVEPDWCTKGHIGLVLEGEIAININRVVQNFKAGDGLMIPSGAESRHKHQETIKPTRLFLLEEA